MKIAIVGHRGVGKSSLLNDLEGKVDCKLIDLDKYIEDKHNKSIPDIFLQEGESAFRSHEAVALSEINNQESGFVVSLGAGYKAEIPQDIKVVWVRRVTDSSARIFLNRPRLNKDVLPSEEYQQRYDERTRKYAMQSEVQINLPEGKENCGDLFLDLLGLRDVPLGDFSITLTEEYFEKDISKHLQRFNKLGVNFFELRNDLLTEDQIYDLCEKIDPKNLLISFRKQSKQLQEFVQDYNMNYDWALELGECPLPAPGIISQHEFSATMVQEIDKYSDKGYHLKVSPLVESFNELYQWHQWQQLDSPQRSFLPRSADGRWVWYRQIFGPAQKIHFIREATGSAADQPTLTDHYLDKTVRVNIDYQGLTPKFAAIIGYPVWHSRTPEYHRSFYSEANTYVVKINIEEEHFNLTELNILKEMGCQFLAVTSPLKNKAFELIKMDDKAKVSDVARSLKAVNTIVFKGNKLSATNTDIDGLRSLFEGVDSKKIAMWGGGGTVSSVKEILPNTVRFSARTGEAEGKLTSPEIVIWGVGRNRMPNCEWPPKKWKPKTVIDLNYSEDSPGKEYALLCGAEYKSGLAMFEAQADKQQSFFKLN